MEKTIIGRLLRSNTQTCVVGCPPAQGFPVFGSLVIIPVNEVESVYGLVSNIHIDDDGLVRQLATSPTVAEAVIQDNRLNRNVPVEMDVLFVGCRQDGRISHLLPPHPPLSLDIIYLCSESEVCEFTSFGRFGYLQHILNAQDIPAADLLAAHLQQTSQAQQATGNSTWLEGAVAKIITQLRDDYPRLMPLLEALADVDTEGSH
jgi:hypothetical protein